MHVFWRVDDSGEPTGPPAEQTSPPEPPADESKNTDADEK